MRREYEHSSDEQSQMSDRRKKVNRSRDAHDNSPIKNSLSPSRKREFVSHFDDKSLDEQGSANKKSERDFHGS